MAEIKLPITLADLRGNNGLIQFILRARTVVAMYDAITATLAISATDAATAARRRQLTELTAELLADKLQSTLNDGLDALERFYDQKERGVA